MRISTRGRYSLETLLFLALLPAGSFVSIRSIAENTGISDGYIEQLFIPLKKSGVIRGIRGPQGGYLLGKPSADITVGDILRSVEGTIEPVACLAAEECPSEAVCKSRHTWKHLYEEILDCVDSISLNDLAEAFRKMDSLEFAI